jgi:lipoyl(octanoyl) transferase
MHWTLLRTPPLGGAENMALDEALLERARSADEAVFRVYTWAEPTLSFGRNQTAVGTYDPARARDRGVTVVRRLTGGRALLHHREVTYSVTAPLAAGVSLRESYVRINRLLVDGLRRLGVAVDVAAPRERSVAPSAAPCFERPATGELVVEGRKLVGSAQWRDEGAMLQHGSILIEDDQPLVSAIAGDAVSPPHPAATLSAALGRTPSVDEVADALFAAVRSLASPCATELTLDSKIEQGLDRALDRYRDDRWTWRR